MGDMNFRRLTPLQGFLIGIVILMLIQPVLLQGIGEGSVSSQQQLTFESISLDTIERTYDTKAQTIKDVFNVNGKLYYRVEFRIIGLTDTFECSIPADKAENLNKEALYLANISILYPKEVYEKVIENNDSIKSVNDVLDKYRQSYSIQSVDFMFSQYITTEFKSKDEVQQDFDKVYLEQQQDRGSDKAKFNGTNNEDEKTK